VVADTSEREEGEENLVVEEETGIDKVNCLVVVVVAKGRETRDEKNTEKRCSEEAEEREEIEGVDKVNLHD